MTERRPMPNMSPETQLELFMRVRQAEQRMFPEFESEEFCVGEEKGTDDMNFYFTPSHHFGRGLINQEMLSRLEDGEGLISFGSGKAYLERLISQEFSIDPSQIVLSDKNTQHLPPEFVGYEFDMHGGWPDFGRKFTYAIFPECFTCMLGLQRNNNDVGSKNPSQVTRSTEALIIRCFDILEDYGEVRVDGHCLRPGELEIIQQELLNKGIEIEWNPALIIAKKATV